METKVYSIDRSFNTVLGFTDVGNEDSHRTAALNNLGRLAEWVDTRAQAAQNETECVSSIFLKFYFLKGLIASIVREEEDNIYVPLVFAERLVEVNQDRIVATYVKGENRFRSRLDILQLHGFTSLYSLRNRVNLGDSVLERDGFNIRLNVKHVDQGALAIESDMDEDLNVLTVVEQLSEGEGAAALGDFTNSWESLTDGEVLTVLNVQLRDYGQDLDVDVEPLIQYLDSFRSTLDDFMGDPAITLEMALEGSVVVEEKQHETFDAVEDDENEFGLEDSDDRAVLEEEGMDEEDDGEFTFDDSSVDLLDEEDEVELGDIVEDEEVHENLLDELLELDDFEPEDGDNDPMADEQGKPFTFSRTLPPAGDRNGDALMAAGTLVARALVATPCEGKTIHFSLDAVLAGVPDPDVWLGNIYRNALEESVESNLQRELVQRGASASSIRIYMNTGIRGLHVRYIVLVEGVDLNNVEETIEDLTTFDDERDADETHTVVDAG